MTRDFLTVEDINSIINSYGMKGKLHEINTALITEDTNDYTNIKYDFCKISRTKNGNAYTFVIEVINATWTGLHYFKTINNVTTSPYTTFNNGKITVETSLQNLIIGFYCTYLHGWESFNSISLKPCPFDLENKETLDKIDRWDNNLPTCYVTGSPASNTSIHYQLGIFDWGYPNMHFYYLGRLVKTDFQFNCTQTLTVGKVNKVYLGALADYKPNGDLVGEYTPSITVDYNGETLPVTFDGTDYYFNLDLSDKTETGKVRFTVNVEANEVLNSTSTDVALNSQYQTVNTFDALLTAVTNSDVIRLGANLTATANIPINRSVKIIGNDKTINLDSHRFVVKEDVEFKAENVVFNNGDTTIIQAKNTKIELTKVTFNNCTSSNYNGLGSCIFCDVDVDSLDVTNDYIATLTECTFTDNANCILHGGQLTIQKCTLDNDNITNININNPAFVYQTDGTCLIQQSTFDINYDYSSTEANIGYAQALIMCGETATINGATHTDLQTDNSLPFFDAPFNNRANLYAKYYYPQITDNVESITTVTDKGCCYSASGVDWVFKNNIQVRRVE